MNEIPTPQPTSPAAPGRTEKSAHRQTVEDLIVTGFGMASSTGVAYGVWAIEDTWHEAIYSWMVNFFIPAGAIVCGLAAAIGYWVGARIFNHKPSRMLLINIVLVSLSTYFAIHYLNYTHASVRGTPLEKIMGFGEYLTEVTENMVYKSSHDHSDSPGDPIGKMGWAVAALQVIGFSVGGFIVFGMLKKVPYCDDCAKYMSHKQARVRRSKDPHAMRTSFARAAALFDAGQLQAAIDDQATHGEGRRFKVKSMSGVEILKCPACTKRRLRLTLNERKGNQYPLIAQREIYTHEPLEMKTIQPA